MSKTGRYLVAGARIVLGWTFLWAFLDKLLGLGFATKPENAWLAGGSPTYGFLSFAAHGPLAAFYKGLAGNPVVDVLFMVGLLGLGLALLLGVGLRIAGIAGPLLMLLMWSARIPPENNPLVDEHIVYAFLLAALPHLEAGHTLGLGRWWTERTAKWPWLH